MPPMPDATRKKTIFHHNYAILQASLANLNYLCKRKTAMQKIFFTPGPSALYFTAEHHLKQAVRQGITSISHRSPAFMSIFEEANNNLRELLQLPPDYRLVFTDSASGIWEKMTDALITERSLHMVNGAFAEKFYKVVGNLGKQADSLTSDWGTMPDLSKLPAGPYDLLGVTHNETSTGVRLPLDELYQLKKQLPDSLLAVDAVSSLPVADFDYTRVDTVYASVQKAFGLPAGLGIWLVGPATEERARQVAGKGLARQSMHSLLNLLNQAANWQTPSTPNILGIYLFAKVTADMIDRGIKAIRNDSIYKATIMYNMLDNHPLLRPFVSDKRLRSDTIIIINSGARTQELIDYLDKHKIVVGNGYGKMKGKQVRIANFPTHSKEQFEMLTDLIEKFD